MLSSGFFLAQKIAIKGDGAIHIADREAGVVEGVNHLDLPLYKRLYAPVALPVEK